MMHNPVHIEAADFLLSMINEQDSHILQVIKSLESTDLATQVKQTCLAQFLIHKLNSMTTSEAYLACMDELHKLDALYTRHA